MMKVCPCDCYRRSEQVLLAAGMQRKVSLAKMDLPCFDDSCSVLLQQIVLAAWLMVSSVSFRRLLLETWGYQRMSRPSEVKQVASCCRLKRKRRQLSWRRLVRLSHL